MNQCPEILGRTSFQISIRSHTYLTKSPLAAGLLPLDALLPGETVSKSNFLDPKRTNLPRNQLPHDSIDDGLR